MFFKNLKTLIVEGNKFVRLIWIASGTSLINIHLLLHFETETTGCIEMHSWTKIEGNLITALFKDILFCLYLGARYSIQLSIQR